MSARHGLSWMPLFALCGVLCGVVAPASAAGDPNLARTLTDRGIDRQNAGDHAVALTLFDAALAEADHPKIRYFRAKSLRVLERFDEALVQFEAIKDDPRVAKYRDEVIVFIDAIVGEQQKARLEAQLARERAAREALEKERLELTAEAEQAAIRRLKEAMSPLYPPGTQYARIGDPRGRIVPLVPEFASPTGPYPGTEELLAYVEALDAYELELTLAKSFIAAALVGITVGVGLAANPLADGPTPDSARQAGLTVGVIGVMSGIAAVAIWPSAPDDPRAAIPDTAAEGPTVARD